MDRTRILLSLLLIGVAGSFSCSSQEQKNPLAPIASGAGHLTIRLDKSRYTASEVGFDGAGFRATVTNPTGRTYYANLGDALNSAPEHHVLWAVEGSDAFLEQRTQLFTWANRTRGIAIEGTRGVELRPNGEYLLYGFVVEPNQAGTYRLRVQYFDDPEMTAASMHEDFSDAFVVR